MGARGLNSILILLGIISGLIGNYNASTPSQSKLLPPSFAFLIWGVIYLTGIYLVYEYFRNKSPNSKLGNFLISLGYLFSGLWVRFDGRPSVVAVLAIFTLLANVLAIYILKKSDISKLLLNLLSTFSGWITVATSLSIADALGVSTSDEKSVALYLAGSLVVAFGIYFFLNQLLGYIGTIAWATLSLLFTKSILGSPGFFVSAIAFIFALFLIFTHINGLKSQRA